MIADAKPTLGRYVPLHLPLGVYEITLRAIDPIELAAFSAATLRGAFGWTMKRMVCYQPQVKTCRGCLLRGQCPYPQVFEPAPRPGTLMEGVQNAPAPYVLRPPECGRRMFDRGEEFSFQVVLVGRAIRLLGYFAVALQGLETQGLGRGRGRARVVRINALPPQGGPATTLYTVDEPDVMHMHEGWLAPAWLRADAAPERVQVEFTTLTRLKADGQVQSDPDFSALYRALLRRTSALCANHTDGPWETDFGALAAAAREVRTMEADMQPVQQRRYSGRQGAEMEVWGRVGRVVFAGDLAPFWPLLQLGAVIHVGKNCTFGAGQYRLWVDATVR